MARALLRPEPHILPVLHGVPAGPPNPLLDYRGEGLDLLRLLIPDPAVTYLAWVDGDSMLGAGIHSGDLAIISKGLLGTEVDGDVVLAALGNELTTKRLRRSQGGAWLESDPPGRYPNIIGNATFSPDLWGVVTHTVRFHRRRP